MRLSLFVLWAMVGWWCPLGVPVWWWWWRRLHDLVPPLDIPERPPRPNWLIPRVIGVVGGVVGGWAFTAAFGDPVPWITAGPHPEPWVGVIFAAATTVGAFIGASLLADIYEIVRGGGKATRG